MYERRLQGGSDFLDNPLKEASLPQANSYKVILSWWFKLSNNFRIPNEFIEGDIF